VIAYVLVGVGLLLGAVFAGMVAVEFRKLRDRD
jgi:predicted Kef-type K+ transport protein